MFTVYIINQSGDMVKDFPDCFRFEILTELEMQSKFPEVYIAYDSMQCSYIRVVDSTGNHFYPMFIYSATIG